MSMIGSQCNKLRDTAMRVEIFFLEGGTGVIPIDTHKQLRDAADTILDLYNKCNDMKRQLCYADEIVGRQCTKIEKTGAENAKLRELVTELAHTIVKCQNVECDDCQFGNPTGFGCRWDAHMRELGIEVDDDN